MIYQFTVYPIVCVYKVLYLALSETLNSYGMAIVFLSIITYILTQPLMNLAEKFQNEEKNIQSVLSPQLEAIKKNFSGAEQHKRIQRLYKRYAYHPIFAVRSVAGLLLQLPFLTAAYFMLEDLNNIVGQAWWLIEDLSSPDRLLGGINLLPILMTAINIVGAFAVKDFSKRERIQASVIAVSFLILLYDASAALLIYWTFNNLLTTIAILFKPCFSKSLTSSRAHLKKFLSAEFIPLSFVLTIFIFIPLDIYLTNAEEIWFSAKDIFPYIIVGAVLNFVSIYSVEKFLSARARKNFQIILFGLTLLFFLQSYLLNPKYQIIDLVQNNWGKYQTENIIDFIIWIYISLVIIYIARRHSIEKILDVGKSICSIFVAIQIFSLCYIGATNSSDKRDYNILTTEHLFEVSAHENIIVFVLDMFDKTTFEEFIHKEPDLISPLDGFTFYPDAVSVFDFTDYSLPQMLTGKSYDNSQSYSEYIQDAWDSSRKFYDILKTHNYDISIYTEFPYIASNAPMNNLLSNKKSLSINIYTLRVLAKLSLFRCLPNFLKKNFVVSSAELWQQEENAGEIQPYSLNNFVFYSLLQEGLTVHNKKNSFQWYHINGVHMPYDMTRDVERVQSSTLYEQSAGTLKISLDYLQLMKQLKIYDNATILILSDHGTHLDQDSFHEIKSLPLVLVKQPNEHGELKISSNPVSFFQIQATILKRFPEISEFGKDFSELSTAGRLHRFIARTTDHPIIEYLVQPDATNDSSWIEADTLIYRQDLKHSKYKIGDSVDYRNIEPYLVEGWTGWFDLHSTWTDGEKSEMIFSIENLRRGRNLEVEIIAFKNVPVASQKVRIYANDAFITTLDLDESKKEYTFVIPKDLIYTDQLRLVFAVSNTMNFFNHTKSYSTGMGLSKLTINYAH